MSSSRERITTSFHQRRATSCCESTKSLGISEASQPRKQLGVCQGLAQTREEHVMLDWMFLVVVFAGLTAANIAR